MADGRHFEKSKNRNGLIDQHDMVAFVSRLHTDTTENDLQLMLENAGVKDVKCFRIKPKDGKIYKTAAFRVSCDPQSAALFYDETTWPCGCELRDWVFYQQ